MLVSLLLFLDDGSHTAVFSKGTIVQQLNGKLLQLHKNILGPRQPLEVFQRLVILGVEALLHCFIHRCNFLLVVLEELILEGF